MKLAALPLMLLIGVSGCTANQAVAEKKLSEAVAEGGPQAPDRCQQKEKLLHASKTGE